MVVVIEYYDHDYVMFMCVCVCVCVCVCLFVLGEEEEEDDGIVIGSVHSVANGMGDVNTSYRADTEVCIHIKEVSYRVCVCVILTLSLQANIRAISAKFFAEGLTAHTGILTASTPLSQPRNQEHTEVKYPLYNACVCVYVFTLPLSDRPMMSIMKRMKIFMTYHLVRLSHYILLHDTLYPPPPPPPPPPNQRN